MGRNRGFARSRPVYLSTPDLLGHDCRMLFNSDFLTQVA